jgi:hypothetical protein
VLENVLGSAMPAFVIATLVSGRAGVQDLARRSLRWRVPLRWYAISLLGPLLIFLICVAALCGFAPLRTLGQNWPLIFTAFLPALAIMILLNNVAEEIGWTGFVFAHLQDRHGPLRAVFLTSVGSGCGTCSLSFALFGLLRRQPCNIRSRRVDPSIQLVGAQRLGQADISAHRPFSWSEWAASRPPQSRPIGRVELHADIRPEQSHEHVAVDKGRYVPEHRLDFNVRP